MWPCDVFTIDKVFKVFSLTFTTSWLLNITPQTVNFMRPVSARMNLMQFVVGNIQGLGRGKEKV